jgi:hypothetical protein
MSLKLVVNYGHTLDPDKKNWLLVDMFEPYVPFRIGKTACFFDNRKQLWRKPL